jgi:PAS domain-containing protein
MDRRFSAQALELEASEKRYRQILETSFDAFVGMDSGGRITDWNVPAENILGWPRAEAIGEILLEKIIPARDQRVYLRNSGICALWARVRQCISVLRLAPSAGMGVKFPRR